MNCFDCAKRVKGRFPVNWECKDGMNIGMSVDFMKIGCHTHWQAKPKPTDKDYELLYESLEGKSDIEQKKLLQEFRFRFQLHKPKSRKKGKQLTMFR